MKKIIYLAFSTFLFMCVNNCADYKPIFSSENINFEIGSYTIKGNEILGNKIYYKLENLSQSTKENTNKQSIDLTIEVKKDQEVTIKDSAGKISEYKITLNTSVQVTDFLNKKQLLDETFVTSTTYKVQSQYSETINLENKSVDSLLENTYRELLLKLTQNIIAQ